MVFFTCNACGESLKKNQVEKHYRHKCRSCEVLTCVDCHKVREGLTHKKRRKQDNTKLTYQHKPSRSKNNLKEKEF